MEGNKKFQWTDELVSEYAALFLQDMFKNISAIQQKEKFEKFTTPEKFKASHSIDVGRDGWEILEFKIDYGGMSGVVFKQNKAHKNWYIPQIHSNNPFRYEHNLTTLLNQKAAIHSVLRKSDGQMFSVGDRIVSKMNPSAPFTIIKIQVINDTAIYLDNCPLDRALKLPPERSKILTTSDGVDIFEGDKYVGVQKGTFEILIDVKSPFNCHENWLTFSTRDKAVEYVKRKKEIFSVDDILKLCEEIQFHNRIHDRADEDYYAIYVSLLENRLLEISKSKIKL